MHAVLESASPSVWSWRSGCTTPASSHRLRRPRSANGRSISRSPTELDSGSAFGRASGRFFASLLSGVILGIGYLMVAFTQRKQGLHDMVSGCVVLRSEPEAELTRILVLRPDERERLER